jgi:uncharacterized protein involved in exopolysaccharide biosynthesis
MKKLSALVCAAALGAAGCMGTSGPKSYEADAPLAVETSAKAEKPDRRTTEPEPTRTPAGTARVHADEIDDSNYQDSLRQLESDLKQDRKALGKAGR